MRRAKARHPPSYFASLYRDNHLTGGHIIKLGPKNDEAAKEACSTWPGGMQVGGGINEENAEEWLKAGASKVSLRLEFAGAAGRRRMRMRTWSWADKAQVIVTSYLFPDAKFSEERLKNLADKVGRDRLVVDIS